MAPSQLLATILLPFLISFNFTSSMTVNMPIKRKLESVNFTETVSQCEMHHCINSSYKVPRVCQCESLCWRKQDCCLSFDTDVDYNETDSHFNISKSLRVKGEMFECHLLDTIVPTITKKPSTQVHEKGYSLISKCKWSDSSVSEDKILQQTLCEQNNASDWLLKVPVSSFSTGESYKNIFCAACNDDVGNIEVWNTSAICPTNVKVNSIDEAVNNLRADSPKCNLAVVPPVQIKIHNCQRLANASCPQTFLDSATSMENFEIRKMIEWLCHVTHDSIKLNRSIVYANPFCAACKLNELDVEAVINGNHGSCSNVPIVYRPPFPTNFLRTTIKSFAVAFDADFTSGGGNIVGLTEHCSEGEIYDPFNAKCRIIFCLESHFYIDGRCQLKPTSASDMEYEKIEDPQAAASSLECPKMRLEPDEAHLNENGTLTVNQRTLYSQESFERVDNDTFYVCVDLTDNYSFNFSSQVHAYLTILCSTLSLVALLLKMITFILIPELRNFPAKMIFCLSLSLFFAQLFFLSTISFIENYPLCATVGVLTHYFFLSSFCWMNILSYDLWQTFSASTESRTLQNSDSIRCRFSCYSCYAWLAPLVIVSTACIFDWTGIVNDSSILKPNYGVILCWISTKTALLIYFAVPLALLLVTNIVFFFFTAANIWISSKATSLVHKKANNPKLCNGSSALCSNQSPHHLRFSLYVKLALIMGLTWLTGFVAAYSHQSSMWYIFILLNASQGVYILLAFTPYRKVNRFIQRQLKQKHKKNYRRRPFYKQVDDEGSSHKRLQRSSTRSSQTTTVSINYSSQSQGHAKAAVVISNSG